MANQSSVDIICLLYRPDLGFLNRQIRSIQSQSIGLWRCHLHDDASGDTTDMEQLAAADDRITLYQHRDRLGVVGSAARAIGMLPPDADIVFFADQDDIWEPEKIERVCRAFEANPNWQLIHSDMALIDEQDRITEPSCFAYQQRNVRNCSPEAVLIRSTVTGCSMAVRSGLLNLAMPFVIDTAPTVYHDRWIALIAALNNSIGVVSEPLTRYRQHGNNQLGAVSPFDRGRQVRNAPAQKLTEAWAERQAVLDALEHWCRNVDLTPEANGNARALLKWRSSYHAGLLGYGLTLRSRSWVDRRAALGLAVGRLLANYHSETG